MSGQREEVLALGTQTEDITEALDAGEKRQEVVFRMLLAG